MGLEIKELLQTIPQTGNVRWIGLRPARRESLQAVMRAEAVEDSGLTGDHYSGKRGSKRQVTLIQHEHLLAVAAIMKLDELHPGLVRRNVVVSGINLLALKDKTFRIGTAILQTTGLCHPCSRMEDNLGSGGYNAMRGHGGITARVLETGSIAIEDEVAIL